LKSTLVAGRSHVSHHKTEALERAEALRPVLAELAVLSHNAAAKALNERGITTAQGKPWTAMQVSRVRARLG
jgi:hypothetical protein